VAVDKYIFNYIMNRAMDEYISNKVSDGKTYEDAVKDWNDLGVDNQIYLQHISDREIQNFEDIREGLLATLHGYQGYKKIKIIFENSLKNLDIDD
jgi:hypothetical protein